MLHKKSINMLIIRALNYKFAGKKIVIYPSIIYSELPRKGIHYAVFLKDKKRDIGTLSAGQRKKITEIIITWFTSLQVHNMHLSAAAAAAARRPIFATLTIPQKTKRNDKELKSKLLKPFLKQMVEKYEVENYLWKAETTAAGQLHFHLLFDHYIDSKKIQQSWNKILNKNKLLESYKKRHGHINAPSTHVRAVDGIGAARNYIAEELTKKQNRRKIKGKVYDCSRQLRTLKPYTYVDIEDYNVGFDEAVKKVTKTVQKTEFYEILKMKKGTTLADFPGKIQRDFFSYYENIYKKLYNAKNLDSRTEKKQQIEIKTEKYLKSDIKTDKQLSLSFSIKREYQKK